MLRERENKDEERCGGGECLALLRCLWKMNHGGQQRGRSSEETHLVKKKRERIGLRKEQLMHLHTTVKGLFACVLIMGSQAPI